MKPILDSKQMALCDEATIINHGIPSMVLMERAAISVFNEIEKRNFHDATIGIVCGTGNNGGDGIAISRLLHLNGYSVKLIVLGDEEKYTSQLSAQLSIAKSYSIPFVNDIKKLSDCTVLIDAIFGIGLSRDVSGIFAEAISFINNSQAYIISVDIPSGFSADSGKLLGAGVGADLTITMAYLKKGLVLGDCPMNCGEIVIADVGIYSDITPFGIKSMILGNEDLSLIPERAKNANKGSCGKVLVIAGSKDIYGACYLCAKAAMVTGSGLVKIYTHENNIPAIQQNLPETMYSSYTKYDEETLKELISWPDAIVIGPGLSTDETAIQITSYVLSHTTVPTLVDADGLNVLATNLFLLDNAKVPIILTPHLKEMSRLCKKDVSEINYNMESIACDFADSHHCTVILKNFTTLIAAEKDEDYFNNSGNEAMATAGSGDVLAGIITSLLGQGLEPKYAACIGTYLHGYAGSLASETTGIRGMLASDIISGINLALD